MKNIFIGGVAKSGKSTLALRFCEKGIYNHIPVDYLTSSFKHNFPELGITSDVIINNETSDKLSLFLSRFISIANDTEELFIIDSAHIMPEHIINYLDKDKWDIYFLGYPNVTSEQKLVEVRKYINDGWIQRKTDDELINVFTDLIDISKNIELQCKKYDIKFIDTSNIYVNDLEI